jgi:hypothetical protein
MQFDRKEVAFLRCAFWNKTVIIKNLKKILKLGLLQVQNDKILSAILTTGATALPMDRAVLKMSPMME